MLRCRHLLSAPLVLLSLAGCRQDIGLSESSRCDGVQQRGEDYVDSAFDRDGDGFFDASVPGCQETYAADRLDCDDTDPDVNPESIEVLCNFKDDDCDEETLDDEDGDGDGYTACDDCDDVDPDVNPAALEVTCDGRDNDCNEATLDARDRDGDGFDECEDCDDTRIYVNPNEIEVFCNGLDDDCNEATLDFEDRDNDGSGSCQDCDDGDPDRYPEAEELCDDGIDNNCNNEVDEECATDRSGTYYLDVPIDEECAFNLVQMNITSFELVEINPQVYVTGDYIGTLTGSFTSDVEFTASRMITGGCTETYTVDGYFTSETEFAATFRAEFTPSGGRGGSCFDCSNFVYAVTGVRR
ncbi:MAG: putative metal-binding motif-containing protein [Alphaproteobacteria bacterium]|nr:putative metal-binding motif-containing protein [Alphaproteobacteria bacterium]